MTAGLSAVVVGADRLGNIPDLLKGHNISITHHISGRDPSHQKKTLQLPSGTQLVILLTDFLGHNVMKTFRNAAQRGGIRVVACRRSVCSMQQALQQCGLCRARARARCTDSDAVPAGRSADNRSRLGRPAGLWREAPRRMQNAAGLSGPTAFSYSCLPPCRPLGRGMRRLIGRPRGPRPPCGRPGGGRRCSAWPSTPWSCSRRGPRRRRWGVNETVVTQVDANVRIAAAQRVEEDQVAGLELVLVDRGAVLGDLGGVAGQLQAERTLGGVRNQAAAIETGIGELPPKR